MENDSWIVALIVLGFLAVYGKVAGVTPEIMLDWARELLKIKEPPPLDLSGLMFVGATDQLPYPKRCWSDDGRVILAVDRFGRVYLGPFSARNRRAVQLSKLRRMEVKPPMCGSGYQEYGPQKAVGDQLFIHYPLFLKEKPVTDYSWQRWAALTRSGGLVAL